jgi:uncharacterized sulfatase
MLRWPGHLAPRRDDHTLVSTIDLAPTILAACGASPTSSMRGNNLLDVATGKNPGHTAVFGEIYAHDVADIDNPLPGLEHRWCLSGDWKLIETADGKTQELYNVTADPSEKTNLAAKEPTRVKQLSALIATEWSRR